MLHGWPGQYNRSSLHIDITLIPASGNFLEFLDILTLFKAQYTPLTLP